MNNTFELRPCIGTVIGTENDEKPQQIEWDQDEIWCNGRRIGHVSHPEGSVCRIARVLNREEKAELVAAIQKLRAEQGKPPVAEVATSLPDPKALKQALNSVRGKK